MAERVTDKRNTSSGRFTTVRHPQSGIIYREFTLADGRSLRLLDDAVVDSAIARASNTARKLMARKDK